MKEKQEATEEHERATVSFALHFDKEVSSLDERIETLTNERDKATIQVEDLEIKLENTKYELNRLQRQHIKLQLDQEKCLKEIESLVVKLNQVEEEKDALNGQEVNLEENKMAEKDTKEVCSIFRL